MSLQPVQSMDTRPLFSILDEKLIALLQSLKQEEWELQTIAPLWKVKDVALHLLDGNIRGISMSRDGFFGVLAPEISSYQQLVDFLNALNADWIQATRRISPALLIDLLKLTNGQYREHLQTLPLYDKALFSVAWAGEQESQNWFHIAREYTEKWHHQQQIRLAVGKEAALLTEELYYPFLDTSLRALPWHCRDLEAEEGTLVRVVVVGENEWTWYLLRQKEGWQLLGGETENVEHEVRIPGAIAWRLLTKGIAVQEAQSQLSSSGDHRYKEMLLRLLAVMA